MCSGEVCQGPLLEHKNRFHYSMVESLGKAVQCYLDTTIVCFEKCITMYCFAEMGRPDENYSHQASSSSESHVGNPQASRTKHVSIVNHLELGDLY